MTITVRAAAKFNLHLGVGPVRNDGFHPLATVYHAIGLYDDVTVSEAAEWQVTLTGEDHIALGEIPTGDDNIVVRAGKALAAHHGIEKAAKVEIHKGIPVAGGLAGGSADAAATLVALDRLWSLETPDEDLLSLAGHLGSDVPFALIGATAVGGGRGEIVEPVTDNGAGGGSRSAMRRDSRRRRSTAPSTSTPGPTSATRRCPRACSWRWRRATRSSSPRRSPTTCSPLRWGYAPTSPRPSPTAPRPVSCTVGSARRNIVFNG